MSLKNFLDLRKKVDPQIKIVERIVFQKRSWHTEFFRVLAVLVIVSSVIYGITRADTLIQQSQVHAKNFSAIGTVTDITSSTISITNAKSSDDTTATTYVFDTAYINTIQTNHFIPIPLSDIKVGDNLILQGIEKDGMTQILRIFSYGTEPATGILTPNIATTTPEVATTTDATSTATTTATTSTSTDATTTPNLIDTIKDVVSNAIDAITGTTSTSTDATSTGTSTDEATTSIQVATTVEATTSTSSNPSVIQTITNAVANAFNAVTGATSSTDIPAQTPSTPDPLPTPTPTPSDTPAPVTPPTN